VNTVRRRFAAAALVVGAAAALNTPTARADDLGCESQFWMLGLRGTTRTICDGPIQADGTWMRSRTFYAPAYISAGFSSCYGGLYYSNCTYTPPIEVAELDKREVYPVTAATVLPDEPGHIGGGQGPQL
jgi:hypothetical protein